MADKGTGDVTFHGRWEGKQLEQDFNKTSTKIKGAAKKTGTAMGDMVGENTGRQMKAFNEKTEKGRQLLTAFGGSLGAAGGQAVYYAGTLTYVAGAFKKWELGAMAGLAALVILGAKMMQIASGPMDRLVKRTVELRKETDKLIDSINKMVEAETNALLGLSKWDTKAIEGRSRLRALGVELMNLEKQRAEWAAKGGIAGVAMLQKLDEEIRKTKESMTLMSIALQDVKTGAAASKTIAGRKAKARGGRESGGGWDQDAEDAEISAASVQQAIDANIKAYQRYQDDLDWIAEIEERRNQKKLANEKKVLSQIERMHQASSDALFEMERQRIQGQQEVYQGALAIMGGFSDALAAHEQASTAIKIIAWMTEAAWQSAMQIGLALASFAVPWKAAGHFAAAAAFAAIAAGKIASVTGSSGGGGGASVAERSRGQQGGPSDRDDEKKQTTIILKIDRRKIGQAVMDAIEEEEARQHPGDPLKKVS